MVLGLLVLAREIDIDFRITKEQGFFPFNFKDGEN